MSWDDYVNSVAPKLQLSPAQKKPVRPAPAKRTARAAHVPAQQRAHVNQAVHQHSSIRLEPDSRQLQQAD
ncbi:MAG: hypothetical protein ACYCW6_11690 [Candidatus Xenobia bacterium]